MNKYGIFTLYTPTPDMEIWALAKDITAQFICTPDPDKKDWYLLQKDFDLNTLKVVYNENGVITQASYDASVLWPVDAFIVEIPTEQIPSDFNVPLSGADWQYNGLRIVPRVYTADEQRSLAEQKRRTLMNDADKTITPLQDAVDLDMATDAESNQLNAWKKYRVLLNRVDTSLAPDIEWPEVPDNVA